MTLIRPASGAAHKPSLARHCCCCGGFRSRLTNHHLRGTVVVVVEDSGLAMGLNKKVAIVTGANTGIGRCNLRFIWFFFEYF